MDVFTSIQETFVLERESGSIMNTAMELVQGQGIHICKPDYVVGKSGQPVHHPPVHTYT